MSRVRPFPHIKIPYDTITFDMRKGRITFKHRDNDMFYIDERLRDGNIFTITDIKRIHRGPN